MTVHTFKSTTGHPYPWIQSPVVILDPKNAKLKFLEEKLFVSFQLPDGEVSYPVVASPLGCDLPVSGVVILLSVH